jgi:hypothetical protein
MVFKGHEYKNEVSVSKNLNLALEDGAAHRNNWREPRQERRRVAPQIDYEQTWKNVHEHTMDWLIRANSPALSKFDNFRFFYTVNTLFTLILYATLYFFEIEHYLWTFLIGCAIAVDIFILASCRSQFDKYMTAMLFLVHAAPITLYAVLKLSATNSVEERRQNMQSVELSELSVFCGFVFALVSILFLSERSLASIHQDLANREFQRIINV